MNSGQDEAARADGYMYGVAYRALMERRADAGDDATSRCQLPSLLMYQLCVQL